MVITPSLRTFGCGVERTCLRNAQAATFEVPKHSAVRQGELTHLVQRDKSPTSCTALLQQRSIDADITLSCLNKGTAAKMPWGWAALLIRILSRMQSVTANPPLIPMLLLASSEAVLHWQSSSLFQTLVQIIIIKAVNNHQDTKKSNCARGERCQKQAPIGAFMSLCLQSLPHLLPTSFPQGCCQCQFGCEVGSPWVFMNGACLPGANLLQT